MGTTTTLKIPNSSVRIIHSALERELQILQINMDNTVNKLKKFEKKYNLSSAEFFQKYNEGDMGDSEDIMLWASEYSALLEIRKEHGDLKKVLASWNT